MDGIPDNIAPTAISQDVTIYSNSYGNAFITTADINNGSSDNCDPNPIISLDNNFFTCSDVGVNTVNLIVTDAGNNSSIVPATITVVDTIAPVVVTKDFTLVLTGAAQDVLNPSDIDNESSDNCNIASITVSPDLFGGADIGDHLVTLTVTDASGNVSTDTATVTVEFLTNTTGIEKAPLNIKAFPNPTNGIVNLQFLNLTSPTVQAQLFDIHGKLIRVYQFNDAQAQVDLSAYPSGMYMLNIQTEEQSKTIRIVRY